MENNEQVRIAVAAALKKAGVDRPCPRCGAIEFQVENEFYLLPTGVKLETPLFDRPAVPYAAITCLKCGATDFHSLQVLGIIELPK